MTSDTNLPLSTHVPMCPCTTMLLMLETQLKPPILGVHYGIMCLYVPMCPNILDTPMTSENGCSLQPHVSVCAHVPLRDQ